MDYAATIKSVHEYVDNNEVTKAVTACLRLARQLQDHLHTAIFLRELGTDQEQLRLVLYEDMHRLTKGTRRFVTGYSLKVWISGRKSEYDLDSDDDEEGGTALAIGVGQMDAAIEQWEAEINGLVVTPGMSPADTAAFTHQFAQKKAELRLTIKTIQAVKERIKGRCLNYAIRVEKQLEAQTKTENFLHSTQTYVNNYFEAHDEDVFNKLQTATGLVDSTNPEHHALLLAEVRRTIKATADHFYPPVDTPVTCVDGVVRTLGDDEVLNRLQEYLANLMPSSSSKDLLKAEFEYLAVFARKLNSVASKGVHADVTFEEAKQGLLGLYMFLFNVISRLQTSPGKSTDK